MSIRIGWLLCVPIVAVYDFEQFLLDFWQVHIRRRDRVVYREREGALPPARPGRVAIVAVCPSPDSLPFTRNLLRALSGAGFYVLVVSSRRLPEAIAAMLATDCHHLIERAPVGRDFGSYKLGLAWLERKGTRLAAAEALILANDSLFYPKCFGAELERMLADPAEWQCLFENFEPHYHAQSFFLLFRRPVFTSAAFRGFWARYRPYSSRRYAIRHGEVVLSATLQKAEFIPKAAYSSTRLVERLLAGNPGWDLAQLAERSPAANWETRRQEIFASAARAAAAAALLNEQSGAAGAGLVPAASGPRNAPPPTETLANIERVHWAHRIGHSFENANPTHTGAIILHGLFGAPIKRDVCYRGTHDIFQVLRFASGFDEAEREAMDRDLRLRGLPVSMHGLRSILWLFGRI